MFNHSLLLKNKDINFLEAYYRYEKHKDFYFAKYLWFIGIEISIFAIITLFMLFNINSYETINNKIKSNIEKYKNIESEIERFQVMKGLLENKKIFMEDIIEGNNSLYNILTEIESKIPINLKVENLNISREKLTMMVVTNKEENIAQFIYNLQNYDCFKNISINGITNYEGQIRTTITADIVRK
ncbi:PilN domain-containing protein [Caloramator sp. Dgby_cultured_2]|uniref:PilN domain-containing protein n=1 Tax=Caloramator sp. Dgby_cultured_2 TaxID=3029174 RepID=UPI00237DF22D|nr:PilN domain-containing protein [Caloramator sp. Dgby_cultured_2]WDU83873.1 PilN domain-containing protein [Caloramator sp. Dgby_cultured_2]